MAIEVPEAELLPPEILWSAVVAPQLLAAGGTCEALRVAVAGEWAINLSGGSHHARCDLSHGFCLVNDVALAIGRLRRDGLMRLTLIVDLDLHQGDGNATIFANADDVFTLSIYEEHLFPMPKMRSDLNVGLPAGTGDEEYLRRLDDALARVRKRFEPEIIVYIAGSDPLKGDPLGSLRQPWAFARLRQCVVQTRQERDDSARWRAWPVPDLRRTASKDSYSPDASMACLDNGSSRPDKARQGGARYSRSNGGRLRTGESAGGYPTSDQSCHSSPRSTR